MDPAAIMREVVNAPRMFVPFAMRSGLSIEIYLPDGNSEMFGQDPLASGQFFSVNVNGDLWRAKLESWCADPGLTCRFVITGRYGDASLTDPHPYPVHTPERKKPGDGRVV
jgi:hypothetical protein